jgi:hypothetical protein
VRNDHEADLPLGVVDHEIVDLANVLAVPVFDTLATDVLVGAGDRLLCVT